MEKLAGNLRMYVYRLAQFDEQINKQNIAPQINRLCAELQTMSLDEAQTRFERLFPYLKRKEGNLRLIARIYRLGTDYILCWLTVFLRGDGEYAYFLDNKDNLAHLERELEINLSSWLVAEKAKRISPPRILPPLENKLQIWLQRPDWQRETNDWVIYESEHWLSRFQLCLRHNRWQVYYYLLEKILQKDGDIGKSLIQSSIKIYGEEDCYILFSTLNTRKILLLIAPLTGYPDEQQIEELIPNELFSGELSALAKRAYPSYLLADENLWLEIENNEGVNLALSSEEESILYSVSTSKSLPLFLNGAAGSGKSTMLFHLFADYCFRHLRYARENQLDVLAKPHPLFLAYNEAIASVAKEKVSLLLSSHHRFLARRAPSESIPDLSPFFQSFRSFLFNLLPSTERANFNEENYFSFYRFRGWCRRYFPEYSPELCWLTIRNFIKGYHLDERDDYLSLEDYQEIPHKERTVSLENFQRIYETVWHRYEQYTREQGKWDDRDLLRKILQLKSYRSEYTAIFCDEAQDFTRLELQLIMRLSVFSCHDLEHQYVQCLPFAFAGDPLQTLNPTGFRWASLKAAFYQEILTTVTPTRKIALEMNVAQLEYNYRSSAALVGFNNLIQLWRRVLLDLPEIKPQKARISGEFVAQKLILGLNLAPETAITLFQESLLLIPCEEGGELDYLQQDELLCQLITPGKKIKVPWNILSAISVKGLEFKQVVLYKFGESCLTNLEEDIPVSEENKYFFNKLYVAASRARENLLIVDTPLGNERLWKFFSESNYVESCWQKLTNIGERQTWQDKIHLLSLGDTWQKIDDEERKDIAQSFFNEGLNEQKPEFLRKAQEIYELLGDTVNYSCSKAWALKLEGKLLEAGKLFFSQENYQQARECFWQTMAWENLLSLVSLIEEIPAGSFVLATFMHHQPSLEAVLAFSQFLEQENDFTLKSTIKQWQIGVSTYCHCLQQATTQPNSTSKKNWTSRANILVKLARAGFKIEQQLISTCFHLAQTPSISPPPKQDLTEVKVEEIPANLQFLAETNQSQSIIEQWLKAGKPLTPQWLEYVAPAMEAIKEYKEAFALYSRLNIVDKVLACFEQIEEDKLFLLYSLFQYYWHSGHWKRAITTWVNYSNWLNSFEANQIHLKYRIFKELAYCDLNPNLLTYREKQNYQKIITKEIINDSHWRTYISIPEIGTILEKLGALKEALTFYQPFLDHGDYQLSQFIRQRYLTIQFALGKNQGHSLNLNRQAQAWNIPLDSIVVTTPKLNKPQPTILKEIFSGLPPNTLYRLSSEGILALKVDRLQIEIILANQQIFIQDLLQKNTLRIDALFRQCYVNSTIFSADGGEKISCTPTNSNYTVTIFYTQLFPVMRLQIKSLSGAIEIKLFSIF